MIDNEIQTNPSTQGVYERIIVHDGDTVESVARQRYGSEFETHRIHAANRHRAGQTIGPGESMVVTR